MADILLESEQDSKIVNYGSFKYYNTKLTTQNDGKYLNKNKIGEGLSLDENGILNVTVAGTTVDNTLSDTSENPVQNKVVKVALDEKASLGETATTAYYGDKGKIAYDHSQVEHAPANAQPNQNTFSNVVANGTTVSAGNATDTLTLEAGNNITITPNSTENKITISGADFPASLPADGGNADTVAGFGGADLLTFRGMRGTSSDCNDCTSYGVYFFNGCGANAPTPTGTVNSGTYMYLFTIMMDVWNVGNCGIQYAYFVHGASIGKIYFRYCNGNVWSDWREK